MMFRRISAAVGVAVVACVAGCDGKISDTGLDTCRSPQQFFEEQVWTPVMADTCATCHYADGIAAATRMKLRTPAENETISQEDLAYNLELVRQVAKIEYKGKTLLLAKPQGELNHGGGVVLERGSVGVRALERMAEIFADPTMCSETRTCSELAVLPARVWRLTPADYEASIRDAVGENLDIAGLITADERVGGFSNNADVLDVNDVTAEQLMAVAQLVSGRVVARLGELAPQNGCIDRDCARRFVRSFGEKMFRRPITDEESGALMTLYDTGRDVGGTYAAGIALAAQGIVQAPQTIYRSELGSAGESLTALTTDEIATSMAYMLTGAPPDGTLRDLAASGTDLTRADVRRAEAERLIATPAGRHRMVTFVKEWLGLTELGLMLKNTTTYPQFTDALRDAMIAETEAFVEHVIFDNEGTYQALMGASYSYINNDLAALYGVSAPGGSGLFRVDLPADERAGIITHASVMSWYAHDNQSGPVFRGKFVRQNILCQQLPPPPNVVTIVVPPPDPDLTTRERFAAHTGAPACAGCHALIDPIGFGMELYDGIGRTREVENGKPVDSSGTLDGADGVARDFVGGAELARLLAESEEAKNCFVTQFTRFAQGHTETVDDVCGINQNTQAFKATGTNIRELVLSMVSSDNFIRRRAPQGQ